MNHRVLFSCLCALSVIFVSSCNETEPWDDTPPIEEPTISICGNGVLETGEQCDGHLLADTGACGAGQRVQSFTCDPTTCQIATKSCEVISTSGYCGNGVIDSNEQCDGTAVATGIAICDPGQIEKTQIVCKSDCTIDRAASCEAMGTSAVCGNGILESGEECDGTALSLIHI